MTENVNGNLSNSVTKVNILKDTAQGLKDKDNVEEIVQRYLIVWRYSGKLKVQPRSGVNCKLCQRHVSTGKTGITINLFPI